jgi:GMC oxidoreductase
MLWRRRDAGAAVRAWASVVRSRQRAARPRRPHSPHPHIRLRHRQRRFGACRSPRRAIRDNTADCDAWRDEHGCLGWGDADLLPYFRRAEDQERGEDAFHGSPLRVEHPRYRHALSEAWVDAAIAHGLAPTRISTAPSRTAPATCSPPCAAAGARRRSRLSASGRRPDEPDGADRRPGHESDRRARARDRRALPAARRRARGPRPPGVVLSAGRSRARSC